MEFNEKIQQLRKQKELTQEQLAEKLYVSRTAISKWESGKGYPSIESLKCISNLFGVSIDELLSSEELLTLAESDNETNLIRVYGLVYSIIDIMAILFIILPLYGNWKGDYIYSVNLLEYKDTTTLNLIIYWIIFITLSISGFFQLIYLHYEKENRRYSIQKCSIAVDIFGICFFAATREPYVNTFLFLLFILKVRIMVKQSKLK